MCSQVFRVRFNRGPGRGKLDGRNKKRAIPRSIPQEHRLSIPQLAADDFAMNLRQTRCRRRSDSLSPKIPAPSAHSSPSRWGFLLVSGFCLLHGQSCRASRSTGVCSYCSRAHAEALGQTGNNGSVRDRSYARWRRTPVAIQRDVLRTPITERSHRRELLSTPLTASRVRRRNHHRREGPSPNCQAGGAAHSLG
jgi:hypothetical protein